MTSTSDTYLDRPRRERDLDALASGEIVDVLVVGGGITGAGVALDAASRGLSVALVERRDLAAGTSRWSSKLVHGGMRYLASGNVSVAAESVRERAILASRVAPHLVRPVPFVVPVGGVGAGASMAAATKTAQTAMDVLSKRARTPKHLFPSPRTLDAEETLRLLPGIERAGLRGGLLFWDGRVEDDVRLVLGVARTAAGLGARIITRCEAIEIGPGGARLIDLSSGSMLVVRARHVVNATGVWADHLDPQVRLRPSRGSHLVLRASALGNPTAVLGGTVPDHFGRVVFAIPQSEETVIFGLTDEAAQEATYAPSASQDEVQFLKQTLSRCLGRELEASDIVGVYSGLRPLLAAEGSDTSDLSRRHAVVRHQGMITITGGKLTTYRRMASDVVDLITDRPCSTAELALVGAAGIAPGRGRLGPQGYVDEISGPHQALAAGPPARLVRRFGSEAAAVASLADGDPDLLQPIAQGVPALGVEVLWAWKAEGALSVDDVLDGRLRLDLVPAWREAAEARVAELVSAVASSPA